MRNKFFENNNLYGEVRQMKDMKTSVLKDIIRQGASEKSHVEVTSCNSKLMLHGIEKRGVLWDYGGVFFCLLEMDFFVENKTMFPMILTYQEYVEERFTGDLRSYVLTNSHQQKISIVNDLVVALNNETKKPVSNERLKAFFHVAHCLVYGQDASRNVFEEVFGSRYVDTLLRKYDFFKSHVMISCL